MSEENEVNSIKVLEMCTPELTENIGFSEMCSNLEKVMSNYSFKTVEIRDKVASIKGILALLNEASEPVKLEPLVVTEQEVVDFFNTGMTIDPK